MRVPYACQEVFLTVLCEQHMVRGELAFAADDGRTADRQQRHTPFSSRASKAKAARAFVAVSSFSAAPKWFIAVLSAHRALRSVATGAAVYIWRRRRTAKKDHHHQDHHNDPG